MTVTPRLIVLIRHAEKPGSPDQDEVGGDPHLSERGQCRAAALSVALPAQFGKPDFIIATQVSADSRRPIETVTPLAQALKLDIDSRFADKAYGQLAQSVLSQPDYADKFVLICWHHGKLPELASALGVVPPQSKWPGTVFDRYWVCSAAAHAQLTVSDLPQKLLYGDQAG